MDKNFVFGAAAAAYQIEGGHNQDGKGPSIWDVYTHQKGNIFEGQNGDVACDHYNRYKQDVALMAQMGLKAYRFSICWSRILPQGVGEVNAKGIEFYNNLIDELLKHGIEPYVTLYHWDLPLALHQQGGLTNKDFPLWFANYATVVVQNFSDRVKYYMTFNEPQCVVGGYQGENRAPGINLAMAEVVPMVHNMLIAHGKAVDAMRANAKQDIKISYAPSGFFAYPKTESPADIDRAREASMATFYDHAWFGGTTWYSDPIMFGTYPKEGLAKYEQYLPEGWQNDMQQIHRPLDFYCQNFYQAGQVSATEKDFIPEKVGSPRNSLGWSITPQGIYWATKFVYERYGLPIYITENGISGAEWVSDDGIVHDQFRIDYMKWHLEYLQKAIDDGIDIRGYFHWSVMDNFEWAEGYRARFGLIFVDYQTQQRTIKQSGYWYKNFIEQHNK